MSIKEDAMRWATIIPLIGGSAIGCAKSTCFPTLGKLADPRRAASVALQRASVSWSIHKRAFEVMYIFPAFLQI